MATRIIELDAYQRVGLSFSRRSCWLSVRDEDDGQELGCYLGLAELNRLIEALAEAKGRMMRTDAAAAAAAPLEA